MTKILRTYRLTLLLLAVCFGITLCSGTVVAAEASGGAIAQGFNIDGTADDFVAGALVSTAASNAGHVQLATSGTAKRLVGIVGEKPLVALSDGTAKTQVVISGSTQVLVSDINGLIRAGDKITASPIAGVGMLAKSSDQIVGTAQSDFDVSQAAAEQVADAAGKAHDVHIGRVSLQIGVSFYQSPTSGFIPPVVQGLADGIAGRPVSFIRIAVCTILLLLAVVSTTVLVYTSVRSGLISIGRNPLAAGAIRRQFLQIGVAVILVLGLVLLASYIILTA